MKIPLALSAICLSLLSAAPARAASGHDAHHAATPPAAAAAALSEGTVKKVDKAAGKLTIAHGPLDNLGMPPMTMVFRVSDAAMVDRVRAEDKVRFRVEKVGGVHTVTVLEPAR